MSDHDWDDLDALLDEAMDLPVDEREAFLDERCPTPEMRTRILRLLSNCDDATGLLSAGGALGGELGREFATFLDTASGQRETIPGYELIRSLGSGGMGHVWEAEQTDPVQRTVAVKIIRPELSSGQVLARFESERRTLALMNHPGIAQIFDAGITDSGRPFFAMELVDGLPLTTFCDQACMSVRERLRLFVEVCEAIQHAHQKGVIHRDLQPTNVLVTRIDGRPSPKVIDFGIARLVDDASVPATLLTEAGVVVGTPEYMSPEQAGPGSNDVDTRSDVYALGVLLFELLTGSLPHQREDSSPAGMAHLFAEIRVAEAVLPSKRVTSLGPDAERAAALRGEDSIGLVRHLRRDLDWIAVKALEKDRARRYASVGNLVEDVRRFLRDEPVGVGPPGATYRFRKFVRRNSGLLAASAAILLALIAGLAGTLAGLVRAQRESEYAQTQVAISQAVIEFLNEDLLAAVAPDIRGRDVTMREVLDAAAERIEGRFGDQPLAEASVRASIGRTYVALGRLDDASPHLERALELREATLGLESAETFDVLHDLGELRFYQGNGPEAQEFIRRAYEGREIVLGPNDPATLSALSDLGAVAQHNGDLDIAEESYREAHRRALVSLDAEDPYALSIVHNLGALLLDQGQYDEAATHIHASYEGSKKTLGEEHPETMTSLSLLGSVYREAGRQDEAEPIYYQVYQMRRRILGDEHPSTLTSANNLGVLLETLGKFEEAIEVHRETLLVKRRVLGSEHDATILSLGNLGAALVSHGQAQEAEPFLAEGVSACHRTLGAGHRLCASTLRKLGRCWTVLGRYEEAEEALLDSHQSSLDALGEEHPASVETAEALVDLYEKWGKPAMAADWAQKAKPKS